MKDRSLASQIWIVFTAITIIIGLTLTLAIPMILRNFFTEEIYSTIESSQELILNRYSIPSFLEGNKSGDKVDDIRQVRHIIIYDGNQIFLDSTDTVEFIEEIRENINLFSDSKKKHTGLLDGEKVLYLIRQIDNLGTNNYLISYMGDSYRDDLVLNLLKPLFIILGFIIVLSWIPALLLAKYLSKPLVELKNKVNKLTKNQWDTEIKLDRRDEIGALGESIEKLRLQLIRQDEAENKFLQNISHELKTPVMVIRSFAQGIGENIFPKGDLKSSIDIIDKQGERLENRIKDLIYFSKLDYISAHSIDFTNFNLKTLIEEVSQEFSISGSHLNWFLTLNDIYINGDREQWTILLENILDNQSKYGKNQIKIDLYEDQSSIYLNFYNDGRHISENLNRSIFSPFEKGRDGNFGLGLAIVKRILDIHNWDISFENLDKGLVFKLKTHKKM